MNETKTCPSCGEELDSHATHCPTCDTLSSKKPVHQYKKSGKMTLFLCITLGFFGIHRFYVGKIRSGILQLCTLGLLGIWVLIDLILITQNKFTDKQKHTVPLSHKKTCSPKILHSILAVFIWLALLFGEFILFANYITSGLVNTVNEQLHALHEGNYKVAYSYYAKEYKAVFPLEHFINWSKKFPALSDTKYTIFDKRGINSYSTWLDSGFLEGVLITNSGARVPIKYLLIKENDSWKIVGAMPYYTQSQ